MAYAVELFLEEKSAAEVRNVWQQLAEAGVSSSMVEKPFQPHMTLAVFDEIRRPDYVRAASEFAKHAVPIEINVPNLGVFLNETGVVFLGVTVTWRLIELHEWFHGTLKNYVNHVWAHYLPGSWVPHVTLAFNLEVDRIPKAIEICQSFALPFNAKTDRIAIVDTLTGEELQLFTLGK